MRLVKSDSLRSEIDRVRKELDFAHQVAEELETKLDELEECMSSNDAHIEELEEELIDLQGQLATEGAGDES